MKQLGICSSLTALLVAAGIQIISPARMNAQSNAAPDFKEVYELVRSHLVGMSEAQLNQEAVMALMSSLGPRVALVTNGAVAKAQAETPLVTKSNVFEGDIGYLRVARIGEGLANALREACKQPSGTNQLCGLVLDLRYAAGDDYASAVAAADLFIKKDQPLMNWGSGVVRSKEKPDAISLPIAVLVNGQTAAAAEALAAVLREAGVGLILGGRTSGQAMIAQEFPLKNGDRLRIGTAPIQLGDGSAMSPRGLKPDIAVEVSPDDERAYYADAYRVRSRADAVAGGGAGLTSSTGGTNRVARRPRFNEAELVRERREGISEADMTALRDREPEKPLVNDPALARALDLLKGLAVVRSSRS